MTALTALTGLFVLSTSQIGSPPKGRDIKDEGKAHWIYQSFADLKTRGLLVGYPDGLSSRRPVANYDFAVKCHISYNLLLSISSEARAANLRIAHRASVVNEDQASVMAGIELRRDLTKVHKEIRDLAIYFKPELKALGVDADVMVVDLDRAKQSLQSLRMVQPGEANRQFSDVPGNHWAAGATKDLRKAGILVGYPDGLVKG